MSEVLSSNLAAILNGPLEPQFEAFLRSTFCEENLIFWKVTNDYQKLVDPALRQREAVRIWNEFVAPNAPSQVNLTSYQTSHIQRDLEKADFGLFLESNEAVFNLMSMDSYPRFVDYQVKKEGEAKCEAPSEKSGSTRKKLATLFQAFSPKSSPKKAESKSRLPKKLKESSLEIPAIRKDPMSLESPRFLDDSNPLESPRFPDSVESPRFPESSESTSPRLNLDEVDSILFSSPHFLKKAPSQQSQDDSFGLFKKRPRNEEPSQEEPTTKRIKTIPAEPEAATGGSPKRPREPTGSDYKAPPLKRAKTEGPIDVTTLKLNLPQRPPQDSPKQAQINLIQQRTTSPKKAYPKTQDIENRVNRSPSQAAIGVRPNDSPASRRVRPTSTIIDSPKKKLVF